MEAVEALLTIQGLIDNLGAVGILSLREDAERHFKDKYSNCGWVMDGLLTIAGFLIKSIGIDGGVPGTHICAIRQGMAAGIARAPQPRGI